MSGFLGNKRIEIQPNDANISYGFTLTVCSSATANDGFLAYGTTASGISVVSYKTADVDGRDLTGGVVTVTDLIQGTPTVTDNVVTVRMSYPSTNTTGRYKITILVTASDGSISECDFNRVIVHDK